MAIEREVKLRFTTADAAREQILAGRVGATPLRTRRLQHDILLDTDDRQLLLRRSALRVRYETGRNLLTFKGPVQPGTLKVREEHETTVEDGATLVTILEHLGFRPWFRYEKYREEYATADAVIAIDETPIGVFVEIEGSELDVRRIAEALGRRAEDYITLSYRALYEEHCRAHGQPIRDMLFG